MVVLDDSVWREVDIAEGLKEKGYLVVNTKHPDEVKNHLGIEDVYIAYVDATKIALEEIGLPITNTAMLGALLKVFDGVDKEAVMEFIKERFGKVADKNIKAFLRAYEETSLKEV